jgi:uncharacterized protein YukE
MAQSVAGIALPEGDPGSVEAAMGGLRRVGGGFERTGGVADRAAAVVPAWTGHAAMAFHNRCGDYRSAAAAADAACAQAVAAIRVFAEDLDEARRRVKTLQARGEVCVERIETAERQAADAGARADIAYRQAFEASFSLGPDAGATAMAYHDEAMAARGEQLEASGRAQTARDELDYLKRQAEEERERVRDSGSRAADRVRAAADGMPSVSRPSYAGASAFAFRSEGTGTSVEYGVFFVRLGEDVNALIEYNTDGSVSITTSESVQLGLGGALGGRVSFGSNRPVIVGRDLHGAALTQLEKGRTYVFPTHEAAREYIDEVTGEDDDGGFFLPIAMIQPPWVSRGHRFDDIEPKTSYFQGGIELSLGATFSRGDAGASVSGEYREAIGHSVDHTTGDATHYFKTAAGGSVSLSLLTAGVSERRDGEAVTAVTYDSDGEPVRISLTSTSATSGGLSVEGDFRDMGQLVKQLDKAAITAEASQGTRVEVKSELVVGPEGSRNAEIVRRYLDSGMGDPEASRELVEAIERDGQIDVRVYDTENSSLGPDIEAGGAKLKLQETDSSATLREAYTRPPGDLRFHRLQVP